MTKKLKLSAIIITFIFGCSEKQKVSEFLWGVAISGFQADMGPMSEKDENSDWWIWTHNEENIRKGYFKDVPEKSSDFWTHYKQDINIAKSIGVNTFRYGIEWSRIFPRPTTEVKIKYEYKNDKLIVNIDEEILKELDKIADQNSIRKYREILSYIRENGLKVFITLNHFSLPVWIHDSISCRDWFSEIKIEDDINLSEACFGKPSGWLSLESVLEFAKYVAFVARKFGDLADLWGPINEPIVVATGGYLLGGISSALGFGAFPPAASNKKAFDIVLKNLILAHSIAYEMVHLFDRKDADGDGKSSEVSVIYNISDIYSEDKNAQESAWELLVWRYLDQILKTDNPKADIIGINYYNRYQVIYAPVIPSVGLFFLPRPCPTSEPSEICPYGISEMGYEIYPPGIYNVIKVVWERYKELGLPILITENGIADSKDKIRGWFIKEHLKFVKKAIDDGIKIIGYFYWSLMDNLEWALGFDKKFGLVEIDFSSPERKRKIRQSAYAFSEEIRKWEGK